MAKRNQAKEEKVLAADNDVSPTDEVAREAAMNTLRAFDAFYILHLIYRFIIILCAIVNI